MKILLLPLIILSSTLTGTADEDIRSKVTNSVKGLNLTIAPGNHIFGHKFGISEKQLIKELGKPTGYIRLNAERTVMIYGRSVGYIFDSDKLAGVRISSMIFDWQLANQVGNGREIKWRLSNGIKVGMEEARVKELLGDKLKTRFHRSYFVLNGYRVELNYVTYSNDEKKGKKEVHGIYLRKN